MYDRVSRTWYGAPPPNLKERIMYYIAAAVVVVVLAFAWGFFVLTEKKDKHGKDFDQWNA
jgi:hypothetical protein